MRTLCMLFIGSCLTCLFSTSGAAADSLPPIRVSEDGSHFVRGSSQERFVLWGVNYDHDSSGRLLDEYWIEDWDDVVEDFGEIRELGANCVRIHLQLGLFMDAPDIPNEQSLQQLKKLIQLAEDTGLYLDITGLACYHKKNIPDWYDPLPEQERWQVQANFWKAIANVCRDSSAVFCFDLMNEPILPGKEPAEDWLAGELGGKFFVQRIALDLAGRGREELAAAWVNKLATAIRDEDPDRLITVGVIPWVFVFGGGKPLFHGEVAGKQLDFVAVHFYPETENVDAAVKALAAYNVGKPLIIEEMFPLKCSPDELAEFIRQSASSVDGWISFYWGTTAEELRANDKPSIGEAITAQWLTLFQQMSDKFATPVDRP